MGDVIAARRISTSDDETWLYAAGFPRDASMWGIARPEAGLLAERLSYCVPQGIVFPRNKYDPHNLSWVEHYAVEMQSPYKAGQLMCRGITGSPAIGLAILYRLTDASGMVYEAALPAGNIEAPESELRQTQQRFSRKVPYPERIIGAQYGGPDKLQAFMQAARRYVNNEATKGGRPQGVTTLTAAEWHEQYARAVHALKRRNVIPTRSLLAIEIGISVRTFDRYKKQFNYAPQPE